MAKEEWRSFLINLSGVVLGILLTFGGNSLWQQHEEKKKTREMLILVRNELQTNKQWFIEQQKTIKADCDVYRKILAVNKNFTSIPKETLEAYRFQTLSIGMNQLTTSAWQILQNSEMIQKMTDKELVIRLADCYFWIEKSQTLIESQYWDHKLKMIPHEMDVYQYFDALLDKKEVIFFYTNITSEDYAFWNLFPIIDAIIDYTINLLDSRGDFQYDMEEKDREINSFIESRVFEFIHLRDSVGD